MTLEISRIVTDQTLFLDGVEIPPDSPLYGGPSGAPVNLQNGTPICQVRKGDSTGVFLDGVELTLPTNLYRKPGGGLTAEPNGRPLCKLTYGEAFLRHFWDFDAAATQYGEFSSDIVLDGDFEIEFDIYCPLTDPANVVLGSSEGTSNCVFTTRDTDVKIRDSAGVTITAPGALQPNSTHGVRIVREDSYVKILVDGVEAGAGPAASPIMFDRLAIQETASFPMDGVIANLKIWKSASRIPGTLIADFPLDSDLSSLIIGNRAAYGTATLTMQNMTSGDAALYGRVSGGWLGPNVIVNGDFSQGAAGWNPQPEWRVSAGIATYSGEGVLGTRSLQQYSALVVGRVYRVSGALLQIASGELQLWTGAEAVPLASAVGNFSADITAAHPSLDLFNSRNPGQFSLDDLSARRFLKVTQT